MTIDISRTTRTRNLPKPAPRIERSSAGKIAEPTREAKKVDDAKKAADAKTVADTRALAQAEETRARDQLKAPPVEDKSAVKKGLGPTADGYTSAREQALREGLAPYQGKSVPPASELMPRLEKTEAWQKLGPDDREQTRSQLEKPGNEGRLIRGRVSDVLGREGFAKQPADQQLQQLEGAVFPDVPPDPKALHQDLKASDGWQSLAPDQQQALTKTLTGGGPNADELAGDLDRRMRDVTDPASEKALLGHGARMAKTLQDPKLDDETRGELLATYGMDRPPYALSKAVDGMRGSPSFQKLSPDAQRAAIVDAGMLQGEGPPRPGSTKAPTAAATKARLAQDPAYKGLDARARGELDRLVGGDNPISAHARGRLDELQKSPLWKHGTDESRRGMLKDLQHLGGVPYGVNNVTPSGQPQGQVKETGASKDPAFPFMNGPAAATTHKLEIERGDRRFHVDVVRPDKAAPGRHTPSLDQIKQALTRLPDDQLSRMEKVVVQPDGEPGSGMSTMGDDGTVHISPAHDPMEAQSRFKPGEMAEIFSHEVGHLASIPPLGQDEHGPGWSRYRAAAEKDGIAPSTYGMSKIPEDFAETYALWRSAKNNPKLLDEYRKLFPNRFRFLEQGGY
jgi:hypothetical protein